MFELFDVFKEEEEEEEEKSLSNDEVQKEILSILMRMVDKQLSIMKWLEISLRVQKEILNKVKEKK